MREVVFVDFARSAFGRQGGGLRELSATGVAAFTLRGLLERTGLLERCGVDAVAAGCAMGDERSLNPARYAALAAGLPDTTEAHLIEMQCGSAITAVNQAAAQIGLGYADVMLVGGMESHSTAVANYSMSSEPYRLIPPAPLPMRLAPTPEEDLTMLQVSDGMAARWGVSREACDAFALRSQERLQAAYASGLTGGEIVPYVVPATKKRPEAVVDRDEFPRPQTTLEALGQLRPVLPGGVTTAGNASGKNDGAAFFLMMSGERARALGYTPYARWLSGADVGVAPSVMGIGPVPASLEALRRAGLEFWDLDVVECNEAFAAQNLSCIRELERRLGRAVDQAKWNPNGGAIAIGHPNGASGARIGQFAMLHLERTGGRYGLFTACCGGGHGTAAVIENLRR